MRLIPLRHIPHLVLIICNVSSLWIWNTFLNQLLALTKIKIFKSLILLLEHGSESLFLTRWLMPLLLKDLLFSVRLANVYFILIFHVNSNNPCYFFNGLNFIRISLGSLSWDVLVFDPKSSEISWLLADLRRFATMIHWKPWWLGLCIWHVFIHTWKHTSSWIQIVSSFQVVQMVYRLQVNFLKCGMLLSEMRSFMPKSCFVDVVSPYEIRIYFLLLSDIRISKFILANN